MSGILIKWHMLAHAKQKPDYLIYMNDAELTDGNLNSVNLTKYGQIKSSGLPDSRSSWVVAVLSKELLDFRYQSRRD